MKRGDHIYLRHNFQILEQLLIKNFNSNSNNSNKYSSKNSSSISAITNFELKYPLNKNTTNYTSTFAPLISARYSPNDTKNTEKEQKECS